jgi:hypothetical protein
MIRNVVVLAVLVCATVAWGDEKDPIREKLFAAKVVYDKEMSHVRMQVDEWFDKREEAARKAGDKKALDQVKIDRKAFDEDGDLPKNTPTTVLQKRDRAKKTLEAAYSEAIKAYTKAKKDDLATAVEKEWANLRKGDVERFHKNVLLGTWRVSVGSYKGDWTFKEDGTVESTGGVASGKWTLDVANKRVLITWDNNGGLDKFDLPLSPKGTSASQVDRMKARLDVVKIK